MPSFRSLTDANERPRRRGRRPTRLGFEIDAVPRQRKLDPDEIVSGELKPKKNKEKKDDLPLERAVPGPVISTPIVNANSR